MEDSHRTYSVLVVAAAAKFHMSLREMLPEDRYDPVCAAGSVSEARRALLERPFDIVVISTRCRMNSVQSWRCISSTNPAPVCCSW